VVEPRFVVAELIAAYDPGIATRLLALHPAEDWCRSCRATAPCSTRTLAEAVERCAREARRFS
jgi:hypothetical protein